MFRFNDREQDNKRATGKKESNVKACGEMSKANNLHVLKRKDNLYNLHLFGTFNVTFFIKLSI